MDWFCFDASRAGVVKVFAIQLLKNESKIQDEEAVQDASKLLSSKLDKINVRSGRMAWDSSCDLSPTRNFSAIIIHFMSICIKGQCLYRVGKELPV